MTHVAHMSHAMTHVALPCFEVRCMLQTFGARIDLCQAGPGSAAVGSNMPSIPGPGSAAGCTQKGQHTMMVLTATPYSMNSQLFWLTESVK
jgi:hypothetical protein